MIFTLTYHFLLTYNGGIDESKPHRPDIGGSGRKGLQKMKDFDTLFQNPDSRFRGAPFWAWNTKLEKERLKKQIACFKEMGMGGFHMHSRTGLDTPYMEEEVLSMVRFCVEQAKENGMYAYLYDEDRWPSGAAGGKVTRNEAYRSRYLVITPFPKESRQEGEKEYISSAQVKANGKGELTALYRLTWEGPYLAGYERLPLEEAACPSSKEADTELWYVYLERAQESPWYNNQTYVDTLNPQAIREFIRQTHEKYYEALKDEVGGCVPSIFTDEPQFAHKTLPGAARERADIVLPYTESFEERYQREYGESFFDRLPEVVWELAGGAGHGVRYRYHELLAEQFAQAFADTLGKWCEEHGLALTGHMMEEPTLQSQTAALGEAMRSYRSFQLPGIDMLCDRREYTTARQAQSAARQYGRKGVLSELYGVTGWDYDFRRHKLQGDWQAALGVTLRVHHLSWMSMAGEAKRDYPASIFYQSPWYKEYRLLEDHFARVNMALMSGKPVVKIGVIHPVESYWLKFGPQELNGRICQEMEERFEGITRWLLFEHLDFDFIAESLLPELCGEAFGTASGEEKTGAAKAGERPSLRVGEMRYEAVIVPACESLRRTTLSALRDFAREGGTVILMGNPPSCLDGEPDEGAAEIARWSRCIAFERSSLCDALEPFRTVRIRGEKGEEAPEWICQQRRTGEDTWVFVARGIEQGNPDVERAQELSVSIPGEYEAFLYDTLTGEIRRSGAVVREGTTSVRLRAFEHDSFLLRFRPVKDVKGQNRKEPERAGESAPESAPAWDFGAPEGLPLWERNLGQPRGYVLSEPNVMLLDMAGYRLDEGEWQQREEILRIDDAIRERLGYPGRMEAVAQPWTIRREKPSHTVELLFHIKTRQALAGAQLALELEEGWEIFLNGAPVPIRDRGYFVDECIRKVELPALAEGDNELLVRIPFGEKTNLEWCYLLGDFGVELRGDESIVIPMPERVCFGDYTVQGFPFYAGNMEYVCRVSTQKGRYGLKATRFRSPLLRVWVDGRDCGPVMIAPYEAQLGELEAGEHEIRILSYGNRANAFGAVHNCDETLSWGGPNAWRSRGDAYSYEYQLRRMGILKAPVLVCYGSESGPQDFSRCDHISSGFERSNAEI